MKRNERPLRTLLALILACALALPAASAAEAGEGKLKLRYDPSGNTAALKVEGLSGGTNVYALQLDLVLDGEYPDAQLIPASPDVDLPDRAPTVSGGKTYITVALDAQVPVNDGAALTIGTLDLGKSFTLPASAALKLLDVKLQDIPFTGAPTVAVQSTQDSGGSTGGGSSSGGGGGPSSKPDTALSAKADSDGKAQFTQADLKAAETLTVKSGGAALALDEAAVAALKKAGGSVTVSLTAEPGSGQTAALRAQTNGAALYTFSLEAGGKALDLTGGTISLTLPFTGKGTPVAYALLDSGAFVKLGALKSKDGAVTLTTAKPGTVAVLNVVHRFTDVDGWYDCYVNTMAAQGVMTGMSDTSFAPNKTMTRAELVTTLARLSGDQPSGGADTGFNDVPAGAWFAPYVAWAKASGVSSGISADRFDPGGVLTREQLAAMLVRFAQRQGTELPKTAAPATFSDAVEIADYAAEAVELMQQAGIVSGKEGGRFDPKGTATRAECAKMLAILGEEL